MPTPVGDGAVAIVIDVLPYPLPASDIKILDIVFPILTTAEPKAGNPPDSGDPIVTTGELT